MLKELSENYKELTENNHSIKKTFKKQELRTQYPQ